MQIAWSRLCKDITKCIQLQSFDNRSHRKRDANLDLFIKAGADKLLTKPLSMMKLLKKLKERGLIQWIFVLFFMYIPMHLVIYIF